MPDYQTHCDECRNKLGRPHWTVHSWLDAAAEAAVLHILADVAAYGMDHVPSMEEAEQLWGQAIKHHPNGKMEIKKRMECN